MNIAVPDDLEEVRSFFRECIDGLGLDVAFRDVERECAELPGAYAPPQGALLLAHDSAGRAVGVAALRALPATVKCLSLLDSSRC